MEPLGHHGPHLWRCFFDQEAIASSNIVLYRRGILHLPKGLKPRRVCQSSCALTQLRSRETIFIIITRHGIFDWLIFSSIVGVGPAKKKGGCVSPPLPHRATAPLLLSLLP